MPQYSVNLWKCGLYKNRHVIKTNFHSILTFLYISKHLISSTEN